MVLGGLVRMPGGEKANNRGNFKQFCWYVILIHFLYGYASSKVENLRYTISFYLICLCMVISALLMDIIVFINNKNKL